jgi:plasmid stabilization system protein ParE
MRIIHHPQIRADLDEIMRHYEVASGQKLADEFHAEFDELTLVAAEQPEAYAIRERDVRRVNLRRFPYHFLFRITENAIRILVLRHHARHPSFGARRR